MEEQQVNYDTGKPKDYVFAIGLDVNNHHIHLPCIVCIRNWPEKRDIFLDCRIGLYGQTR